MNILQGDIMEFRVMSFYKWMVAGLAVWVAAGGYVFSEAKSRLNPRELVVSSNGLVVLDGNVGVATANPQVGLDVSAVTTFRRTAGFVPQQVTVTQSTTNIDWGKGNFFLLRLGSVNTTLSFTNPPRASNLVLFLDHNGTAQITWPATGLRYLEGIVPTPNNVNGKVDLFNFYFDGAVYYVLPVIGFDE